ncbi:hypothetical protein BD413DRAFT_276339 [Trametes elegans]|nr:hypothetical protein BD413DRAFT_276339 [Trametes elegans]
MHHPEVDVVCWGCLSSSISTRSGAPWRSCGLGLCGADRSWDGGAGVGDGARPALRVRSLAEGGTRAFLQRTVTPRPVLSRQPFGTDPVWDASAADAFSFLFLCGSTASSYSPHRFGRFTRLRRRPAFTLDDEHRASIVLARTRWRRTSSPCEQELPDREESRKCCGQNVHAAVHSQPHRVRSQPMNTLPAGRIRHCLIRYAALHVHSSRHRRPLFPRRAQRRRLEFVHLLISVRTHSVNSITYGHHSPGLRRDRLLFIPHSLRPRTNGSFGLSAIIQHPTLAVE